jgi:drug/metabolite transporter (DMT)-like permease
MLLTFGRIFEGSVAMPLLFCDNSTISDDEENGCVDEKQVVVNGNYVGELQSMNGYDGPKHNPIKRRRRKKTVWREQFKILRIYIIANTAQRRSTSATAPSINPEILQILGASLAGMLLLPLCYTTGLILTNPTVASVWDGPMIPLGVFFTAVGLGVEKLSRKRPLGQVLSLLLTVGGSVIVLCADFLGPHNSLKDEDGATIGHASHWQFIQGNIVLMGVIGAYTATSLLQKQLTHYPSITLTAWMFMSGFAYCCCLLVVDSALYSVRGTNITGCTLGQAIYQLSIAFKTSPTFRYGLVYASLFVGGACFTIMNYASSHLEASSITLFAATQPPITAVLEFIWEGKELGFKKICGMICVGIGMLCFTRIKKLDSHHRRKR